MNMIHNPRPISGIVFKDANGNNVIPTAVGDLTLTFTEIGVVHLSPAYVSQNVPYPLIGRRTLINANIYISEQMTMTI